MGEVGRWVLYMHTSSVHRCMHGVFMATTCVKVKQTVRMRCLWFYNDQN